MDRGIWYPPTTPPIFIGDATSHDSLSGGSGFVRDAFFFQNCRGYLGSDAPHGVPARGGYLVMFAFT